MNGIHQFAVHLKFVLRTQLGVHYDGVYIVCQEADRIRNSKRIDLTIVLR